MEDLEERLKKLERDIQLMRDEAKEREVRQLKYGVRVLGLVVIAMAGWIWSQVGHIFDVGNR